MSQCDGCKEGRVALDQVLDIRDCLRELNERVDALEDRANNPFRLQPAETAKIPDKPVDPRICECGDHVGGGDYAYIGGKYYCQVCMGHPINLTDVCEGCIYKKGRYCVCPSPCIRKATDNYRGK